MPGNRVGYGPPAHLPLRRFIMRGHQYKQSYWVGARRNTTAYIAINTRLCGACWKCINACPKGVIGKAGFIFHKHARIINPGACTGCLACAKACPEGAIKLCKEE